MYKVTVITKYNTIELIVDDLTSPELEEVFAQPYVLEIRAERLGKVKTLSPETYRKKVNGENHGR